METSFKNLFEPGKIGNLTLKNRLVMSVFPTGFAEESQVSEQFLNFYLARAKGGVALIVVEPPCLDFPTDYKGSHQLRIDKDSFLESLKNLVQVLHQEGAKVFIQLTRPAKTKEGQKRVETMTSLEIKETVDKFAAAARKIQKCGFDGVEIQAAYGGLLSQLLSPHFNKRTDEYGGSLENRVRFLLEVVRRVKREARQDFPVQVKLTADEYLDDGFRLKEASKVAFFLEEAGVNSLLISAGTKETKKFSIPPYFLPSGVLVPLAAAIKKEVKIPVIAMGKIKDPYLAEEILAEGKADFIGMTRALVTDPDFPKKAREGRVKDIRGCIACNECTVKPKEGPKRQCLVNPALGREKEFEIKPAALKKKIWVLGGGPAGMEAAIITAERGHQVTLFEKSKRLGGLYNLASLAPHKKEVAELNRYLIHRVKQVEVKVVLNKEITAKEVAESQPEVVFIATGSKLDSPIPGSEEKLVVDAHQLWTNLKDYDFTGKRVVIIGGGFVGCETAQILADEAREVIVVEMLEEALLDINKINRGELLSSLQEKGVKILCNTKAEKITREGVIVQKVAPPAAGRHGGAVRLAADFIILAITRKPNNQLAEELQKIKTTLKGPEVYLIGDALKVGNAGLALRSAALTALHL